MAWNPSPEVATARDFAKKFGHSRVIILHESNGEFGYVSYGATKTLCASAKRIANRLWEPFCEALTEEVDRPGQGGQK